MRRLALAVFSIASAGALLAAVAVHRGSGAVARLTGSGEVIAPAGSAPSPAPGLLRFVAVGGGPSPESTEVSLEHDIALAARTLKGPGVVFFGGGPESQSVRVLDSSLSVSADGVLVRLGDLFQPRAGRGSRYRRPKVAGERATRADVERQLSDALSARTRDPLTLFIAAHGERGETPRDNYIPLWGGDALSVADLASLHDAHPRPLRVVVAACFSGGFAELAFRRAEERDGLTRAPRCGLFAGPWDRETGGCDPNPDRRAHEGYSVHMLNALHGRDKDARPISSELVDFDADGRISLLEAHTRARIASRSIDVPTTTSERFLRAVSSRGGEAEPSLLPEERAVTAALGKHLKLDSEEKARVAWRRLTARLTDMDDGLAEAEEELTRRASALSSRLLERWPILDDPYHPDFADTLARNRDGISQVLGESPEARAYNLALSAVEALDARYYDLAVEESLTLRLVRAHETLSLASGLRLRDPELFDQYETLLGCERGLP